MKVNPPKKLYISNIEKRFSEKCHSASIVKYCDDDIEYTRTDSFIERACEYLNENCRKFILTAKDIEDFRNYMKRE